MSAPATDARTAHAAGVERLLESYRAVPTTAPVRLAKRTSNLFRTRAKTNARGLDTSGLTDVIAVDPEARTADVAGMCTYEDLVAATLPFGLAPLVVPQLKTITLGGAVTGLGIESTSFRNGLPHESVLEMDILTGAGEVVTASPGEHADLFRAFPNSYGTLGYAVRLRIELEPVQPFVALTHLRFHALADLVAAMDRIVATGRHDGVPVDYLDGVVFSADESYLCVGVQTAASGPVSDYTGQQIYYRSIQHDDGVKTDRLTIHDYLWRWDTDWFWCSEAFGAQHPLVRRFWPRRYRRSSSYWKLMRLERRFGIGDRLEKLHGRPPRERVIQDIEVPIERMRRVPGLVPGERADRADLAVPAATARRRRAGRCIRSGRSADVRQRRLLVDRAGRGDRGGDEPADRAQGRRARRPQVALLRRLLLRGGVRRALRRRDLPGREAAVRPRLATARPVCEGGATAMTTFKDDAADAAEGAARPNAADGGGRGGPTRRKLTLAEILEIFAGGRLPLRFTAYDGSSAGPADAPFGIELKTPRGTTYLATGRGDLGLARAYIAGDLDIQGVHPGDPVRAAQGARRRASSSRGRRRG